MSAFVVLAAKGKCYVHALHLRVSYFYLFYQDELPLGSYILSVGRFMLLHKKSPQDGTGCKAFYWDKSQISY